MEISDGVGGAATGAVSASSPAACLTYDGVVNPDSQNGSFGV